MPVSSRYSIGIDFGTESGRVLLLNLDTGEQHSSYVVSYASGVIDRSLPQTGEKLPPDWALQDPADWTRVVLQGIPEAVARAQIDPAAVVGIGVDFTSCTVLPVAQDDQPLCEQDAWREHKHAWPKLWKHHAAQPVADRLNDVAIARAESFLTRYGGRISSEWYFPKLIEVWLEDRAVYDAMDGFIEATDWITSWMTGRRLRQTSTAGYKAFWSPDEGLPSTEYFDAAYPGFSDPAAKLGTHFVPLGTNAGTLRPELAQQIGLPETVAVAVGNVDAFVSLPGAGVSDTGTFVIVIGTSICDMVVHPDEIRLPGITGVVRDGILPGMYGYEAGQAAVGDMLAWFVDTLGGGVSYEAFEAQAAELAPGETGLLALDWWNGNRTILADADLSGAILGLTIQSSPAEIYRALLESIAFGSRRIIDNFEDHGMRLTEIVACGGIAERSPLMMQLLADTSGRPVLVPGAPDIPARGSALFGAVAAGVFPDIGAAVAAEPLPAVRRYEPDPVATETYERVYGIYRELYETLGRSHAQWLHGLKQIRIGALKQ
jgi:L-ribulokinase